MSWSLSARRAWIEIFYQNLTYVTSLVALRKESVDRNCDSDPVTDKAWVALRKESVDRNYAVGADHHKRRVALRKESVDRNAKILCNMLAPSVALRKESVDRNKVDLLKQSAVVCRSPQGERG